MKHFGDCSKLPRHGIGNIFLEAHFDNIKYHNLDLAITKHSIQLIHFLLLLLICDFTLGELKKIANLKGVAAILNNMYPKSMTLSLSD